MADLHCPTCGTLLLEHDAGLCLELWVGRVMGWTYYEEKTYGPNYIPASWSDQDGMSWDHGFSIDDGQALHLMSEVWKRDQSAVIGVNCIGLFRNTIGSYAHLITGPTFAVRVCRALILLARKNDLKTRERETL